MPKEVIHSCEQFSGEYPAETLIGEIRWGHESEYVQLATLRVATADHAPVKVDVEGGWYVNLDRRGINDLIRFLRRARDQAFGRDE